MLKPLEIEYRGRLVVLECTHKRDFPPPVMYGHTPEDIDVMWRSGNLSHTAHQFLQTWHKECGLMVMGPKCLDCRLAKKQNPRPGRLSVIETEPWLERKERMYWDDMAAGGQPQRQENTPPELPIQSQDPDEIFPDDLPPREEPADPAPAEARELEEIEEEAEEDEDISDPPSEPKTFGFSLDDDDIVDRLVDD